MATTSAPNGHNGHRPSNGHHRPTRGTTPPSNGSGNEPPKPRTLPHSIALEQSVLGAVMLRNDALRELDLDIDDFFDLRHKAVWQCMKSLAGAKEPIDIATLDAQLVKVGRLDAIGGPSYLGELILKAPTTSDNALSYARELRVLARNRKAMLKMGEVLERAYTWQHDPSELVLEIAGEMQRLLELDPSRARWRTGPALADEIWERRNDPWVALKLGIEELVRVQSGGLIALMGGTGSGKTSLAASIIVQHARDIGPAVMGSLELPGHEFGARIVGIRCGERWDAVLRGQVRREFITDALALPRLYVLDRSDATLENIADAVRAARVTHPDQPILVAIDYAQLLPSEEWDARAKVADVFQRIDELARRERCVVIALSQMARGKSRQVREGDAIGAETTDSGAESAAIERWATVTMTIGKAEAGETMDSTTVELNIGKVRMGGVGDRVIPMLFNGKTGEWTVAGASKSASEIRSERAVDREKRKVEEIDRQILAFLLNRLDPCSRNDALESVDVGNRSIKLKRMQALIDCGLVVEIAKHADRSKAWQIMHSQRAQETNATTVQMMGKQERLGLQPPTDPHA